MAIEQYTTTTGSNTNVIASVRDFTDDQKAAFNELLARFAPLRQIAHPTHKM